jgi:hypothetical protein
METLIIPLRREIFRMSYKLSQQERICLLNEIVFARGDEQIGGTSHPERILACKEAIAEIDAHLRDLSGLRTDVGV